MSGFSELLSPEATRALATIAFSVLVQSTLIIAVGLAAAKPLRRHGAANPSVVLRVTLVAVLTCPAVSWLLSNAGIAVWGFDLPRAHSTSVDADALPSTVFLDARSVSKPMRRIQEWTNASADRKPDDAVRCYFNRGTVNSQTVINGCQRLHGIGSRTCSTTQSAASISKAYPSMKPQSASPVLKFCK